MVDLCILDELLDGLHRQRSGHHHEVGEPHHSGNRDRIAQEIERQPPVERDSDGIIGGHEQKRVTVGPGVGDRLGGKISAHADPVFDHESLT